MFKVCILLALAFAAVASAQDAPIQEAAPEPYSYGYQTDSHAASEQRDPSGKVTGFYTLVDNDGRERRVEYIADEAGFRAKIATNEVGTKSESPADVEITASEPTAAQLVVYQQAPAPQVQYASRQVVKQAAPQVAAVQQPIRGQVAYTVQQPQNAYYTNGYNNGAYYGNGYNNGAYYGNGYNNGAYYGYAPGYAYGAGYNYLGVGNYNNHLPSQYYRSISSTGGPATYTVNGASSYRYIGQPGANNGAVRTVTYPAGGVAYGSSYGPGPAGVTTTRTVGGSSNLAGSSNYLVLQKRAASDDKKKSS